MNDHSRPDIPIVHHDARLNGHCPHPVDDSRPESTASKESARDDEPAVAVLNPPRRFLLCHDDEDDDLPLVETIPPGDVYRIDPALVRGRGIETDDYALLSLDSPGRVGRDTARCGSAISALDLFSRVYPLRLIFLDPATGDAP